MPVATFTADFTKWNEALKNAQAGLKSLELSGAGVKQSFERMAKSLAGIDITRQANLAAAAIEKIGGAAVLTTKEAQKFNAIMVEAIEKATKMGSAVPEEWRKIEKATRETTEAAKAAEKAQEQAAKEASEAANQLERMTKSLSGGDIKKQANIAAAAVQSIGGASKLTKSEQAQLNATLTEAIAKYRALGEKAPAEIVSLANATKKAAQEIRTLDSASSAVIGTFNKIGGLLAGTFAISSISSAIKGVVDFGSALSDTSAKTGISVSALQELKFAGAQVGVSLDDITLAVLGFQKRLVDATPATAKALGDIGLAFKDLKGLAPEDQFTLIAKKLGDIEDPARRNKDAFEIMGKTAGAVLPLIANHLDKLREKARDLGIVLSDEDVNKIDKLGDAWDSAKIAGEAFLARVLIPMIPLMEKGISSLLEFGKTLGSTFDLIGKLTTIARVKLIDFAETVYKSVNSAKISLLDFSKSLPGADVKALDQQIGALALEAIVMGGEFTKQKKALFDFGKTAQNVKGSLGGGTFAEANTDTENLVKSLAKLNKELLGAEKAGFADITVFDQYGSEIKKLVIEATVSGVAIPKAIAKWSAALGAFDLSKVMDHIHQVTAEVAKAFNTEEEEKAAKRADASMSAQLKAFLEIAKGREDLSIKSQKVILSDTEFELAQIERTKKDRLASIDPNLTGPLLDKLRQQIVDEANAESEAIKHAGLDRAIHARANLVQELADAKQTYHDMVESHAFSQKEIEAQAATSRLTLKRIQEVFGNDWKKVLTQMGVDWHAFEKEIGASWAKTLGRDILGALKKTADAIPDIIIQGLVNGASFEDIAKSVGTEIGANIGEAVGTAFGGAAGGAIGKALGSLLGPLLGKLIRTRAEQLVDSVAADFGEKIDTALGKKIDELAKSNFGGSRQAAQIASLQDIISAGGGITDKNLGQLEARLHDVFSLLETGEFTASQAQKVLNDNFQTFVDFLGGKVNPALKEIIRLNDQFGTQSKAIAQFVDSEANKALQALTSVITKRGALIDQLQTAKTSDERDKLQKQLSALPLSQIGAQAEGSALFGIFSTLTKDGASFINTLKSMQPVIDSLDKQLQQTGFDGGAGFAQLKQLAGIATDEIAGPALESIQSLGQALEALNNSDILDQQTFTGFSDQITKTFEAARAQLIAEGKDGSAALNIIAPQLQEIWELQKDFGFAVDDATQKLLDQAIAADKVGEKHRTVQEQTLDVLNHVSDVLDAIGQKFGVVIPRAIDDTAGHVRDATGDIEKLNRELPDRIDIPVNIDVPDRIQLPKVGTIHVPVKFDETQNIPGLIQPATQFARGGPVYAAGGFFAPRGTDTIPAMLSPGEFVVSREGVYSAGLSRLNAINRGQSIEGQSSEIDYAAVSAAVRAGVLAALQASGLSALGTTSGRGDALDKHVWPEMPGATTRLGAVRKGMQNALGVTS